MKYNEKTRLYYYGARYLDPKASRWLSADPAVPAGRRGENLPGMGSYMANMQNGLSSFFNAASANNYKTEHDSDEGRFEGAGIVPDLITLLPAAKGVNIVKRASQIFSTKGMADSIFSSANNDSKIQKFINSLAFSVLGGSENKEEALVVAGAIAAGALVYDQKKLEKKGIDQNDWAKAVKDQVYGRSNKLYNSVMAGNYD